MLVALQFNLRLKHLRIERFMSEDEIMNDAPGLTKFVKLINALTPQGPPSFRSETIKMRFLRNAELSRSWTERAIKTFTTSKYTLNEFVTALREQLQLETEKRTRALATSSSATLSPTVHQRYGRVLRKTFSKTDNKKPIET